MMSGNQVTSVWCTKDDVLQDLALATGSKLDVDEHCLVYGGRPPPRPECDIDDEMKLLFGHKLGDSEGDQFVKPDLKGIMSMIRMVETEEENISPKVKPTDIIVISKLNPNVKEFVPKSQASQTDTPKANKTTSSPLADAYTRKETPKSMTASPLAEKKNSIGFETPIHTPSLSSKGETNSDKKTRKEILKSMTPSPFTEKKYSIGSETPIHTPSSSSQAEINSLKDKILSKTCEDPYEHRRKKNAAIATLLRHCTTPPVTKNNLSPIMKNNLSSITKDVKEKPIKLYTPEFFERCKASDFKGTDDNSTVTDKTMEEPIKETINKETETTTDPIKTSDIEHTNLTPEMDKNLNLDDPSSYELVEQQKSIVKVTEWLDGRKEQKKTVTKPVILAGSIAYKRKEVMSPSSTASATIDKKISKHDIKAYVPSNYATELRMKYENNKKESKKPVNIWDNLEEQLKKRDDELKKKLREGGL